MAKENSDPKCQKCNAAMEQGFLVNYTNRGAYVQRWAAGIPEGIWFGEVSRQQAADAVKVVTWRCQHCGYLESYARLSHLKEPVV